MDKHLIADMRFNYAGQPLEVGDPFTANAKDAETLVRLKRAHEAKGGKTEKVEEPATKEVKTAAYKTRNMKAK